MTRGENDEVIWSISDTICKYYVNVRKKLKVMPTKIVRKELIASETLGRWKQTPLKKPWISGIK